MVVARTASTFGRSSSGSPLGRRSGSATGGFVRLHPFRCICASARCDEVALDLTHAIHVAHSTGGGEVACYIGRHGTKRVAKAVLIGAIPPLMLKTTANPGGTSIEAFVSRRLQSTSALRTIKSARRSAP